MKKARLVFGVAGLLASVAGCDRSRHAGQEENNTPRPVENMSLENTDWILVELEGKAVEPIEPQQTPSIRFDKSKQIVAGNNGVNQFSGTYTLEGRALKLGLMRSTLRAGPPEAMEREMAFMKALASMTDWRIAGNVLEFLEGEKVSARLEAASGPETAASVTGTVLYREKIALRPAAVLEVTLEDVSLADAPSKIIATHRRESPGNPPFAFVLEYDPARIDERHTYTVRAKIHEDGKLVFTSDTAHPVLTRGSGGTVEVLVRRAGG